MSIFSDLQEGLYSKVAEEINSQLASSLPSILNTQIRRQVNSLMSNLPSEKKIERAAKQVSDQIIDIITNRLFSIASQAVAASQTQGNQILTKAQVSNLYAKFLQILPPTFSIRLDNAGGYQGLNIRIDNLQIRRLVSANFSAQDFEKVFRQVIEPFALKVREDVGPAVRRKVFKIAGLTFGLSFALGSLTTYFIMRK